MLTTYLIITASVTAATILWRTLQDDHPKFKSTIERLPLVGESLICGVCVSFWFSLPVIAVLNPLASWRPEIAPNIGVLVPSLIFLAGWMCVSVGVLFFRSAVIVLLESGAILKHTHRSQHKG